MLEFDIDGFYLHAPGIDNIWLQSPIEGIEAAEYVVTTLDKAGEDGGYASDSHYGGRLVTLTGMIQEDSPATFEALRRSLFSACAIKRDDNGRPILKRCSFMMLSGLQYFFYAVLHDKPQVALDEIGWSHFMIPLYAPDNLIYDPSEVVSGHVMLGSGGGFVTPATTPIVSSAPSGGSQTLTNTGNADSAGKVIFYGPLTNPVAFNKTTGKTFGIDYTVPTGSYVTVDMLNHTVTLNDSSPLLNAKADGSDWWKYVEGDNNIQLLTDATGDTGYMIGRFFNAFTGV